MSDKPYREPAPQPPPSPDAYAEAWARIRRRRRIGWAGLALLPVGALLCTAVPFAGVATVGVSLLMMMTAGPGKCPRCGKPFARRVYFHNGFTRHCLNCGIKIGTPMLAS